MFTYLDKYLQSQKISRFLLDLSRRMQISLSDSLGIKKEVMKMKKISKEMIEEMSDAELLSLILKQFQGLEYLFQHMCTRTLCNEFEKLTSDEK